ncbi:MAG: universal stress protein [Balneolaceae bacterium]|nr:MAG: universal stress protein [Balneolaceae bacterium]
MIQSKHWLACLDLTKMDDVLIGYSAFLSSVVTPETITFLHVIHSGPNAMDIVKEFPEINTREEFETLIRNELKDKIKEHFNETSIEIRIVLKEGRPTDQIVEMTNTLEPDLLMVGSKIGYAGEGIIPKRILNYVASSVLFIPENCRYGLDHILVPVDFSEQSAVALKTAVQLMNGSENDVTAQHIYHYRAQFFPYMLTEKEKRKVDEEVEQKKEKFKSEFDIPSKVEFSLDVHKSGKVADVVYERLIEKKADLIVIASKSKKMASFIREDFTDKMVDYVFGVPLLIQKNKEKYKRLLDRLFKED